MDAISALRYVDMMVDEDTFMGAFLDGALINSQQT
jgi:hypothetical protein